MNQVSVLACKGSAEQFFGLFRQSIAGAGNQRPLGLSLQQQAGES